MCSDSLQSRFRKKLNGVLGHDSVLQSYTGLGTTWANEMDFVTNHAPGVESIALTF